MGVVKSVPQKGSLERKISDGGMVKDNSRAQDTDRGEIYV
jgi:hypothetical protein